MKKVIVIRGPLGVGKTTVSKMLAEKLNAEYLSVDKILDDNMLSGEDGTPVESFLKVNEIIFENVKNNKKCFVIDGNFYYQKQIDDLKNKFRDNIVIFTLTSDEKTCIQRDLKREKSLGEESTRYVYIITTKIKEGYEVDNSFLTVEKTVEKIMEKINNV